MDKYYWFGNYATKQLLLMIQVTDSFENIDKNSL